MTRVNAWTPEAITRFWQYYANRPESNYFSEPYGGAIVEMLSMTGVPVSGRKVLDYGCGRGNLAEHLLRSGARVAGFEQSVTSVDVANKNLREYDGWLGALAELPTAGTSLFADFDVVTCVEVVEHLDDATLEKVLSEIHGLVRPGGTVLFTTPNNEHLESNFVFCPFCDSEFHQVQHMRSFDAGSLRRVLTEVGFVVDFCRGVNLLLLTPGIRSTLPEQAGLSGRVGRVTLNAVRLAWRAKASVLSGPGRRDLRRYLRPGDNLVAIAQSPGPP